MEIMERFIARLDEWLREHRPALHRRGQHVIIECEDRNTAEYDDFFIGRIASLGDESVSILYFDSMGTWYHEPSVIAYEDITQVQFDTPYIITITKHLKQTPAGDDPRSVPSLGRSLDLPDVEVPVVRDQAPSREDRT